MEYRPIEITNGVYEVGEDGTVRRFYKGKKYEKSVDRYKIIVGSIHSKGYRRVGLGKTVSSQFVHRLVALAFVPLVDGKTHVNHIDGNKLNNHFSNLEWCTPQENNIHAIEVLGLTQIRPVVVIDKKGNFIAEYRSHKAMYEAMGSVRGYLRIDKELYTPEYVADIIKPKKIIRPKRTKYIPNTTTRKLTDDQVRQIRSMEGMRHYHIACIIGCKNSTVKNILLKGAYRDVV